MNKFEQLKHTDRMFTDYRKALDEALAEEELRKNNAPKITKEHRAQLDECIKAIQEAKAYTYWYHEDEESRSLGDESWYKEHSRRWTKAQGDLERILDDYTFFFTIVPEGAGLPTKKHIRHRYNNPDKDVAKYRKAAEETRTYIGQQYKEWLDRGGADFIKNPQ